MITVYMHGSLGKEFTTEGIEVDSTSLSDIMQLLLSRFGVLFRNTIEEGEWHLILGNKITEEVTSEDKFLAEDFLQLPLLENELHIFPAITGAGGKGIGQIILGVVLIVVAVVAAFVTGGYSLAAIPSVLSAGGVATSIALAGVMAIAGGVMSMLTKTPTLGSYEAASVDQRLSFIFNGPVNNTEQGVPVPLVYGRHLTGSTVIYAGMDVEQL